MDFADSLEGKATTIGTIAMIDCCLGNPSIRLSPQEVGQLRIHHRRQVFPDNLFDIQTDHLKQLSRSLLNLLENIRNLRYCHFQLHGAFSFLIRFMGINPSKGKAPFFLPFSSPYEFHTKDITLPTSSIPSSLTL